MPLTPDEITAHTFALNVRGYERKEVESFLRRVAADYAAVIAAASPESTGWESLGREAGTIITSAKESAEKLRSDAEEQAKLVREQASEEVVTLRRQAEQEAAATIGEARKTAATLIHKAERDAQEVRESTERRCQHMLTSAFKRYEWLKDQERELAARLEAVNETFQGVRTALQLQAPADAEPSPSASDHESDGASANGSRSVMRVIQGARRPSTAPPPPPTDAKSES